MQGCQRNKVILHSGDKHFPRFQNFYDPESFEYFIFIFFSMNMDKYYNLFLSYYLQEMVRVTEILRRYNNKHKLN